MEPFELFVSLCRTFLLLESDDVRTVQFQHTFCVFVLVKNLYHRLLHLTATHKTLNCRERSATHKHGTEPVPRQAARKPRKSRPLCPTKSFHRVPSRKLNPTCVLSFAPFDNLGSHSWLHIRFSPFSNFNLDSLYYTSLSSSRAQQP